MLIGLTIAMLVFGPDAGIGAVSGFDIFVGATAALLIILFTTRHWSPRARVRREE